MSALWHGLSATSQDLVILAALILPILALGFGLLRGFAPGRLIRAFLTRYRWVNALFVGLIAVSVAINVALLAQERGLREASARAAAKFDLIVAAPGNEVTLLFATVFLEPTNVALLGGDIYAEIAADPRVALAAPLAFGDSHEGAPIVGTTADFVTHLSDGNFTGRMFETQFEALAGSDLDLRIGDSFVPAHGVEDAAETGLHDDRVTIVGTLPRTGSPWDKAILTPVEGVWLVHSMGAGQAYEDEASIALGGPYDPALFPGTPAILVQPKSLTDAYVLHARFAQRADTMAFFPGTVLARLHGILGDMRAVLSLLAGVTQGLVAASVIAALFILARLYRPQLVLLRTLGAPTRFIIGLIWAQAMVLLTAGTGLGLVLGVGAAALLSRIVSVETGIPVSAALSLGDMHAAAAFLVLTSLFALGLGANALRQTRTAPR